MIDWVHENTKPTDIIMSHRAAVIHYLTGRKTLPLYYNHSGIVTSTEQGAADYLILANFLARLARSTEAKMGSALISTIGEGYKIYDCNAARGK